MYELKTVNITLKVFDHNVIGLETYLGEHFNVISYKILPETEALYDSDDNFKLLVKNVKKAQRLRDDYIHSKK